MGRPSKFNTEAAQQILNNLRVGVHLSVACKSAGVAYRTVQEWVQIGQGKHPTRKQKPELVQFALDMAAVEAHAEILLVERIVRASKDDWRAAAFMLTRRWPERWANRSYIRVVVSRTGHKWANQICEAIVCNPELSDEAKRQVLKTLTEMDTDWGSIAEFD